MNYELRWTIGAMHDLQTLDRMMADRIMKKIEWITSLDDPLRYAVLLHDAKIGNIRFRIGDYRAIALVDRGKKKISIVAVGHRREIYR